MFPYLSTHLHLLGMSVALNVEKMRQELEDVRQVLDRYDFEVKDKVVDYLKECVCLQKPCM